MADQGWTDADEARYQALVSHKADAAGGLPTTEAGGAALASTAQQPAAPAVAPVAVAPGTGSGGGASIDWSPADEARYQELATAKAAIPTPATEGYGGFQTAASSKDMNLEEGGTSPYEERSQIAELLHPTKNRHKDLDAAPDWQMAPELYDTPIGSFLVHAGTAVGGIGAVEAVLKQQGIKVERVDDYLTIHSRDGNIYTWKPGLQPSDIARMVKAGLIAAPAAMAAGPVAAAMLPTGLAGIGAGAFAGGGGALLNEGAKALAGGGFDPMQVPLQAVLGGAMGAFHATPPAAPGAAPGPSAASRALQFVQDKGTSLAGRALPRDLALAALTRAGQSGSAEAVGDAAAHVGYNAKMAAAAEAVQPGLSAELPPSLTADPKGMAARHLQRIGSTGASPLRQAEDEAVGKVARAGDNILRNPDPSVTNNAVARELERQHAELVAKEAPLHDTVEKAMLDERVPPYKTRNLIDKLRRERGGSLPAEVQTLETSFGRRNPDGTFRKPPTYGLLRDERRLMGSRLPGGPYANTPGGFRKLAYGAMADDAMAAAEKVGVGDTLADANETTQARKKLEDKIDRLFGNGVKQDENGALQITGSMAPKVSTAAKAMAAGNHIPMQELLADVPKSLHSTVVKTGLNDLLGGNGMNPASFGKFVNNWYGVIRNAESRKLVRDAVGGQVFTTFHKFAVLARELQGIFAFRSSTGNVGGDMARIASAEQGILKDVVEMGVFPTAVKATLGGAGAVAGAAAGFPIAGVPGAVAGAGIGGNSGMKAGGGIAQFVRYVMSGEGGTPMQNVERLVLSPEFRTAAKVQLMRAGNMPVSPPLVKRAIGGLVNSTPFNLVMKAAGVPSKLVPLWAQKLITGGLQVGAQEVTQPDVMSRPLKGSED